MRRSRDGSPKINCHPPHPNPKNFFFLCRRSKFLNSFFYFFRKSTKEFKSMTTDTIIQEPVHIAKRQRASSGRPAKTPKVKSYAELKNPVDKVSGLSQCFRRVTTTMYVSLAPMHSLNPLYGIKSQHLDPLLMTWYAPVGGVILAYNDLQLLGQDEGEYRARKEQKKKQQRNGSLEHEDHEFDDSSSELGNYGKIVQESPYAFLWIAVGLLVWKPQQGDLVQGVINLQAPSHLSLLVNDVFHASIRRDSIPDDWSFVYYEADETFYDASDETANAVDAAVDSLEKDSKKDETTGENGDGKTQNKLTGATKSLGYWVDGNGDKVYEVVKFSVKRVLVSGKLISVQGSLRDGNSRYVKTNSSSSVGATAKPKKIIFDEIDSTVAKPTKKVFSDEDDDNEMANISQKISDEIAATGGDANLNGISESAAADLPTESTTSSTLPKSKTTEDDFEAPQYDEDSDSDEDSD